MTVTQCMGLDIMTLAIRNGSTKEYTSISKILGRHVTPYEAKVVKELAKAGLLISRRGIGGGFMLTKQKLSVLDVCKALDPCGIQNHTTTKLVASEKIKKEVLANYSLQRLSKVWK